MAPGPPAAPGTERPARRADARRRPRIFPLFGALLAACLVGAAPLAAAERSAPIAAASQQALDPSTRCGPGSVPHYVFGFADLKAMLGDTMGDPVTCEYADPNGTGDVHQTTTKGLAFWRKSTNTPTFTDGYHHWAHTAAGWVYWIGSSIDPAADAQIWTPDGAAGAAPSASSSAPTTSASDALPPPVTVVPAMIAIPKLKVDATIVPVGLEANGEMQAPSDPDTVGWYSLGPGVGGQGNAVLAGHVDWGGRARVFRLLNQLAPGDQVLVHDKLGTWHTYQVQWSQSYLADEAPVSDIFAQGSAQEVTLITCGGEFDTVTRQYASRLIVRAAVVQGPQPIAGLDAGPRG